jgi:hypothetical protein
MRRAYLLGYVLVIRPLDHAELALVYVQRLARLAVDYLDSLEERHHVALQEPSLYGVMNLGFLQNLRQELFDIARHAVRRTPAAARPRGPLRTLDETSPPISCHRHSPLL